MKMLQVEKHTHFKAKEQALKREMSIKDYVKFLVDLDSIPQVESVKDLKTALVSIEKDNGRDCELMEKHFDIIIAFLDGHEDFCITK